MKYRQIKVSGHRRSGTHYTSAVISLNFVEDDEYSKIYEKHKTPEKLGITKNRDTMFIYVWRDFDSVSKSLYNMRKRFGLNINNFETFLQTRYCDMFDGNRTKSEVNVKVETLKNKKIVTNKVGGGLKNVKMTPFEFWKFDKERWEKIAETEPNVLIVKYDDLISDFDSEMKRIATAIGSNKQKFVNINKKIGWTPIW